MKSIVTVFNLGYLKPASGTWASAVTVLLCVVLYEAGAPMAVPALAVLATLLGLIAVPAYLKNRDNKDPSEVVIDEVAGQAIAMCFTVIPLSQHGISILTAWPAWLVPFLLFRLFDIWKPSLIGKADRRKDALGVMLDDILAGILAGICAMVLAGLYHGVVEPWLN